jgi:hypothetical protein
MGSIATEQGSYNPRSIARRKPILENSNNLSELE